MKQAIIDIGSNSIRLTLYETEGEHFKTLFREKIMAGLAGYVENRTLSAAGIECACSALLNFQSILQTLKIDHICVFATASLRNISNTGQARSIIRSATGYDVEILSGERRRFSATRAPCRSSTLQAAHFSTSAVPAQKSSHSTTELRSTLQAFRSAP